jgi:quinol-cytochrome oxidoreductase complex cytochrome b subunit
MADHAGGRKRHSLLDWLEARFQLTETFSFLTSLGIFPLELDNRLPLREALAEASKQPMRSYMRFPRVLGLLAAQLLFFLGLTGVMLAFYYRPTAGEAHQSVTTIVRDVNFGWLVHQSHLWAGRALVVILLLRLVRFFFEGLYKAPREGIWMIAGLGFAVACFADLTGRLLTWDTSGYWSTVRGVETLQGIPIVGPAFVFLIGGTSFDSLALTRSYVLHAALLPLALLLLFHFNLVGVRRVGLSALPGEAGARRGSYRVYAHDLVLLSVLVFGAVITLATLWPQPFGAEVDPFTTPPGTRPPWYLLAAHALLESMPAVVPPLLRGTILLAGLLLVLLLPFLDRSPWRPARERRWSVAAGVAVLALLLYLSWQGYRMEVPQ